MVGKAVHTRGRLAERIWRTTLRMGVGIGLLASGLAAAGAGWAAEVYRYRDQAGVEHFSNVPTDRRFRSFAPPSQRVTLLRFKRERAAVETMRVPRGGELHRMIVETAKRFSMDASLVYAVVQAESGFDSTAVSPKGASGLMQLMPETAVEVGVEDLFHPRENLEGGSAYLRGLLDRYNGDVKLALAAYNAGPGAVDHYGGVPPFEETRTYLRRVFRFRQEYLRASLTGRRVAAVGTGNDSK